jgi:O-antigen ligase
VRERLTELFGPLPSGRRVAIGIALLAIVYVAARLAPFPLYPVAWFQLAVSLAIAASIAYVLWYSDPVWLVSIAVALSVFSGSWEEIGFPGGIAPDRLLLVAAIAVVAFRGPAMRGRPPFRLGFVHLVLAAAAAYAIGSALAAGTLLEESAPFRLLDRFTLLGFAAFVVAPVIFAEARQRNVLLGALVALGGYLGVVALFETLGLHSLIFPSYIADPGVGIHYGRARGPFLESGGAASALFTCAVAAAIAAATWQQRWARFVAVAVLALCVAGQLFTLLRSAWIGTALAVLLTMVLFRELRRYLVPALMAGAVTIAIALLVVPGLAGAVDERASSRQPEWDRRAQYDIALNMFEERPLLGFGWATYSKHSAEFTEIRPDYPFFISATGLDIVHNVPLANLAELGLIGTTLWLLGLIVAVGGAITTRGSPELLPWRMGLLAIAIHFTVLMAFTQLPAVFPNLVLFVWAGVVSAGIGAWRPARAATPRLAPAPA